MFGLGLPLLFLCLLCSTTCYAAGELPISWEELLETAKELEEHVERPALQHPPTGQGSTRLHSIDPSGSSSGSQPYNLHATQGHEADDDRKYWMNVFLESDGTEQELRQIRPVRVPAVHRQSQAQPWSTSQALSLQQHGQPIVQGHVADPISHSWLDLYQHAGGNAADLEQIRPFRLPPAIRPQQVRSTGAATSSSWQSHDPRTTGKGTFPDGHSSVEIIDADTYQPQHLYVPARPSDVHQPLRLQPLPSHPISFDINSVKIPDELDYDGRKKILESVKHFFESAHTKGQGPALLHPYQPLYNVLTTGLIRQTFGELNEIKSHYGGYFRELKDDLYAKQPKVNVARLHYAHLEGGMDFKRSQEYQSYIWQRYELGEGRVGSVFRLIGLIEGSVKVTSRSKDLPGYRTSRQAIIPIGKDSLIDLTPFEPVNHDDPYPDGSRILETDYSVPEI